MTHRTALVASVILTVLLAIGIVAAADQLFARQTAASVQVLDPAPARSNTSKSTVTGGDQRPSLSSPGSSLAVQTVPRVSEEPQSAESSKFAPGSDDRGEVNQTSDRDRHERAGKRNSRDRDDQYEHEEGDDD